MVLQMPSSRGTSISVIAAISEKQGLVHYKLISGSNNKKTFKDFVIEMVRKIKGRQWCTWTTWAYTTLWKSDCASPIEYCPGICLSTAAFLIPLSTSGV